MRRVALVLLLSIAAIGCSRSAFAAEPETGKFGFLKGNTHVHTDGSGDSETPVADVARWYQERGFDFIVVTDHNNVIVYKNPGKLLVIPGVEMTMNVNN